MSSKVKAIMLTVAMTTAAILLGFAYAIGNDTLTDRYILVAVCLPPAAAAGAALSRPMGRWFEIRRRTVSFAIASGLLFSLLIFAFHAINYCGSDRILPWNSKAGSWPNTARSVTVRGGWEETAMSMANHIWCIMYPWDCLTGGVND